MSPPAASRIRSSGGRQRAHAPPPQTPRSKPTGEPLSATLPPPPPPLGRRFPRPRSQSTESEDSDSIVLGRRSSLFALAALAAALLPAGASLAAADASTSASVASAAAAVEALDGTLVVKSLRSRFAQGVGSFMRNRQRADGGARLLAPIKTARRRLRDAAGMLLAALDGAEPAAVAAAAATGSGSGGGGEQQEDHEAALSGRLFGGDGRRRRRASGTTSGDGNPLGIFGRINERAAKKRKSSFQDEDGLPRPSAFQPILEAVRAGSGECYTFDALDGALPLPQSLVGGSGGANCTLSLVARNAASALPTKEVRGEALRSATLDEADAAIRAVRLLDDMLERAAEGDRAAAAEVAAALERALRSVAALEGLVAACLNFDGEQPTSDYDE